MSTDQETTDAPEPGKGAAIKPRPAEITGAQRRYLRAKAHALKPKVFDGKGGLNDGVISATLDSLDSHEMIKVSAPSEGNAQRREIAQSLATNTGSHVAQTIGHIIVLFRQKGHGSEFKLPTKTS